MYMVRCKLNFCTYRGWTEIEKKTKTAAERMRVYRAQKRAINPRKPRISREKTSLERVRAFRKMPKSKLICVSIYNEINVKDNEIKF